jgi:hypothetical protein
MGYTSVKLKASRSDPAHFEGVNQVLLPPLLPIRDMEKDQAGPLDYPSRSHGRLSSTRSACDRCRGQKLRCLREEHNSIVRQPCIRCLRARAECITSSARPAGRPPRAGSGSSKIASARLPAPAPAPAPESTSTWPSEPLSSPLSTPFSFIPFSDDNSQLFDFPLHDGTRLQNTSSLFEADLLTDSLHQEHSPSYQQINTCEARPHPPAPTHDDITSLLGFDEEHQNQRLMTEVALRLSSVNLDLARQLFLAKSSKWDVDLDSISNCGLTSNLTQQVSTPASLAEKNPLGEVLRSTSEFLAIIDLYAPAEDSTSGRNEPNSPAPSAASACSRSSPGSPHSITTTLALLSCYLQIIAIYDAIFRRVYVSLCGLPKASAAKLQTIPSSHLAGFPLRQRSLQIKILIQIIEHQSEMIEKALGLPVEYRVSARQDHYVGLLDGTEAKALLGAVMGLGEGTLGMGKDSMGLRLGLGYVVLLRENIKRVQQLL